jgi:hypothetical protein
LGRGNDLNKDKDKDMGLASSWLKRRCVGTSTLSVQKTLKGPKTRCVLSAATRSLSLLLLLKRTNHIRSDSGRIA